MECLLTIVGENPKAYKELAKILRECGLEATAAYEKSELAPHVHIAVRGENLRVRAGGDFENMIKFIEKEPSSERL